MTFEFLLNSSRILTKELKWFRNCFQILQEFWCCLVNLIGRSETLSDNQIAVQCQAGKRTQMVSEFCWNLFRIISELFRNSIPSVNYDWKSWTLSQKQTAVEFLKNSKRIAKSSSFSCWNYSKILRRKILEEFWKNSKAI